MELRNGGHRWATKLVQTNRVVKTSGNGTCDDPVHPVASEPARRWLASLRLGSEPASVSL